MTRLSTHTLALLALVPGGAAAPAQAQAPALAQAPTYAQVQASTQAQLQAQAQAPTQVQAPTQSPAPGAAATKVLLEQASYWYDQKQPEEAQRALDRLLRLDPDNADALALQAQLQAERGDRAAAQASLARLRSLQPANARIGAVEQALRLGAIDPAGLAEARKLAQDGRSAEAVTRYQRL